MNKSANQHPFILVVEDDQTQALIVRRLLEAEHYEAVFVSHGAEALALLKQRKPVLIISDVVMPIMDGYTLCQQVKQIPDRREVPFMLLTMLVHPADIFKGLESGADYYCLKPYKTDDLRQQLQAILQAATVEHPVERTSWTVDYHGQAYSLVAGRSQILNLLLATFENVVKQNQELQEANRKLTQLQLQLKTLEGLIPICSYCKKIKDDRGYWEHVESYVAKHSRAQFSHGICPHCFDARMAELSLPQLNPPPGSQPVKET